MGVKRYAQDECGANGPTRRMAIILNCQLSIVNCHLSNYNEINNTLLIYN
jgi:hypothetical protein